MTDDSVREKVTTLLKEGKTPQEIRQQTNASKSYIYKIASDLEKEEREKKAQGSQIETEQLPDTPTADSPTTKETPTLESAEGGGEPTTSQTLTSSLLKGYFTESDLKIVFDAVNEVLPEKAKKSATATSLLGKIWCKPANRMIEKYMEQNVDLYMAVTLTLVIYAPSIWAVYKESRQPKPKPTEGGQNGTSS